MKWERRMISILAVFLLVSLCSIGVAAREAKTLKIVSVSVSPRDTLAVFFELTDGQGERKVIPKDSIIPSITLDNEACTASYDVQEEYRRGTAYAFLIDVSGSNVHLPQMISAMKEQFDQLGPNDKVCLITCGEKIKVVQPYTNDVKLLKSTVGKLACIEGESRLYTGLMDTMAYIATSEAVLPDKNVIILFSDGFNYDTEKEVQIREIIERVKKSNRVYPIYGVSFDPGEVRSLQERKKELQEVVDASKGRLLPYAETGVHDSYQSIFERIKAYNYMEISLDAEPQQYEITINCKADGMQLSDSMSYNLYKELENKNLIYTTSQDEVINEQEETTLQPSLEADNKETADPEPIEEEPSSLTNSVKAPSDKDPELFLTIGILGAALLIAVIAAVSVIMAVKNKQQANRKQETNSVKTMLGIEMTLSPLIPGEFEPLSEQIEKQLVVGSSAKLADLVFDFGEAVEPRHFVLEREGTKLFIFNASSKNETYINGFLLTSKRELRNEDIIAFGGIEAVIHF